VTLEGGIGTLPYHIKMKIKELRKLNKKELINKKAECEELIMSSYGKVKPLIKREQVKGVRRTIAQINTLLKELK